MLLLAVAVGAGLARVPYARALTGGELWAIAARDAAPWPALQVSDGQFYDYVSGAADGAGRYGESMLGYGLLQSGLHFGDRRLITSALRAIAYAVDRPWLQVQDPSVFESFALAAAYDLARVRLVDDPAFRLLRRAWRRRLELLRPICLRPGSACPFNKQVVEAAAVLELVASGARSHVAGTWLSRRRAALRVVAEFVNHTVPAHVQIEGLGSEGSLVLSDIGVEPLAYHALTLGFYARCLELLGRRASYRAWGALEAGARASWLLAAPDGELSYVGRSQEQSWTLPLTVYGVEVAAHRTGRLWAARFGALAQRAIDRLQSAYPLTHDGLLIVPALAQGIVRWYRGMDDYAAARPYNGLTIVALNLAAEERVPPAQGGIAADAPGAYVLRAQSADMAVVRSGNLWFAVKREQSTDDLRDDFGLVALEALSRSGWRAAIPIRPHVSALSDGPLLLSRGQTYAPYGDQIAASGQAINLSGGGFSTSRGSGAVRSVNFVYQPAGCGVRLSFPAQPGDRYRYSLFFPQAAHPAQTSPTTVSGGGESVTVDSPVQLALQSGYASATEEHLARAQLTFSAPLLDPVMITVCG